MFLHSWNLKNVQIGNWSIYIRIFSSFDEESKKLLASQNRDQAGSRALIEYPMHSNETCFTSFSRKYYLHLPPILCESALWLTTFCGLLLRKTWWWHIEMYLRSSYNVSLYKYWSIVMLGKLIILYLRG